MPLLLAGIYCLLKVFVQKQPVSWQWALLTGILAGCVLWTKYSMLGFYLPWGILMLVATLRWGTIRQAAVNCGMIVAGVIAATLPWLIYFGMNQAIEDWFTVYFYNNLFLYSSAPNGLGQLFLKVWKGLCHAAANNKLQAAVIGVGLLWGLIWPLHCKKVGVGKRLVPLALLVGLALTTYGAGSWLYYFQIFMIFVPLGFGPFMELAAWLERRVKVGGALTAVLCAATLAAGVGAAFWRTPSRSLFGQKTEETVQYQFRQIVQAAPDSSMTMRHMLDGGFYTICEVFPTQKFIGKFNLPLPGMKEELDRYVTERQVAFVVARCEAESWEEYKAEKEPFILQSGYVQVADGEGPYLDNGKLIPMKYYLYQRTEDAGKA